MKTKEEREIKPKFIQIPLSFEEHILIKSVAVRKQLTIPKLMRMIAKDYCISQLEGDKFLDEVIAQLKK